MDDFYQHIGLPPGPKKPIKSHCRSKNKQIYKHLLYAARLYKKNSIIGVNPVSNRKMFFSYIHPVFLYGTETMEINKTDLARLETSFRSLLKKMMSLSKNVSSPAVYPSWCVFPAVTEGHRDTVSKGTASSLP